MCGKGSQTQTSTSAPNPQAMQLYQNLLTQAQSVAGTPYTPYTGELVAPINQQQSQGIAGINNTAGFALPNIQTALGYANAAAQPITAQNIAQYTNPYTESVVNATQAQFNNQNQQQLQGVRGNAIAQGALGGNREAIAEAELANQQQLAQAPVIAGLQSQGYQQGVGTALAEQAAMGQGAYSVGNLGVAGENAGLTGANAQIGAGTLEQQTQQAQLAAAYQQFLNQQAYPFQTTQWLAGIGTGVGSQMGGTSSTTGPAPNTTAQWLGLGLTGAGLFLNKGGSVPAEGVVPHRDGGGGVNYQTFGGGFGTPIVPYSGGKSWVPSMGITHGAGAPRPPGLPTNQGLNLSKQMQQVEGIAGKINSGDSSFNTSQLSAPELIGSGEYVGLLGYNPQGEARGGVVGYADGGDANIVPDDFNARFTGENPLVPQVPLGALPGNGFNSGVAPSPDTVAPPPRDVPPPVDGVAPRVPVVEASDGSVAPRSVPRGIRNNNPGNIEDGSFAQSQPGYRGSDGRFAIFETPEAGVNAQSALLGSYGARGINTISGIINRWAPAADNNNTAAYVAAVSKMTGLDPNQPLDMSDPNIRMKLATAIGKYENGVGALPAGVMEARNYNRAAGLSTTAELPPGATPAQYQDQQSSGILPKNLFNLAGVSPEIKRSLMAAGLGMMASRSPFLGVAIGEGGEQGLQTYGALQQRELERAMTQRKIDLEAQKLSQEADRWQKDYTLKSLPYQGVLTAEQKAQIALKKQELEAKLMEPKPYYNTDTGQMDYTVRTPEGDVVSLGTGKIIVGPHRGQSINSTTTPGGVPNDQSAQPNPLLQPQQQPGFQQAGFNPDGVWRVNSLQSAGPADYSNGSKLPHIEHGMAVPEPAPVAGYSPDTIKTAAEWYLKTGKQPIISRGASPVAQMQNSYARAVMNYGNALAASRGVSREELTDIWQTAPRVGQFILGQPGQQIVSLGTAMRHLETLKEYEDAWQKAKMGDTRPLNAIQAYIKTQWGSDAATNLNTVAHILGPEIIKAIGVAGAGTDRDREGAANQFTSSNSDEQVKGAIQATERLLRGQLIGKENQARAAGLSEGRLRKMIGDREYDELQNLDHAAGGTPAAGAAAPAAQPQRVIQQGWVYERQPDGSMKAVGKAPQ